MRPIHRAIHFDFHTMPGIHDIGRCFDANTFAQQLADAHVDYINFFAHCNVGFAYYPTKYAIPYPGLQFDLFGEVLRACHERGIGVTAYINVGIMHEQLLRHPEYCRIDKDGHMNDIDPSGVKFFQACYNSIPYHDFLMNVIREICAYDIDGLFCDCMNPFPCHCEQCTKDMLALGLDASDEHVAFDFSYDVLQRISKEIKDILGHDKYLYFNGMPRRDFRNLDTHIEIECLPSGPWGYDYFWANAAYARTIQKTNLYMTGRFQANWGDFGGYKGKVSIENDLFDGLCNNFLPSVGDHMHPTYGINPDIYKDIGDIYSRIMQYEKYTENASYRAEIAVLTASPGPLGRAYSGAARMLNELKLSYNILHFEEDFSAYRLVILPEGMLVTNALKEKLSAYIQNGGKILSSGTGGLTAPEGWTVTEWPDSSPLVPKPEQKFALPEYKLRYLGADPSNASYFTFTNLPAGSANMPWSMYEESILMEADNSADVRAEYVKPYLNKIKDSMHCFTYTPPEKETGAAAAAVTGSVAHICFNVFTAYYNTAMREHRLLVGQLIDELMPNPLTRVVSGVPSTARITQTGTDVYTLLHVKVTFPEPRGKYNIVEDHVTLKAGAVIEARGEYKEVYRLPDMVPFSHEVVNGYTRITLPEVTGYDMFLLQ